MTLTVIATSDETLSEAIQQPQKLIWRPVPTLMNFFCARSVCRELLPKIGTEPHAGGETIEVELFVRRVRIVIGQCESEQQRVRAQLALEIVNYWDRTPFAHQHRFVPEAFLQRAQCRLRLRACR